MGMLLLGVGALADEIGDVVCVGVEAALVEVGAQCVYLVDCAIDRLEKVHCVVIL